MKKLLIALAIVALAWGVAGAEEPNPFRGDPYSIAPTGAWVEVDDASWQITVPDCQWQYKKIFNPSSGVTEGTTDWEPFGVSPNWESIGNGEYIWLKRQVCK